MGLRGRHLSVGFGLRRICTSINTTATITSTSTSYILIITRGILSITCNVVIIDIREEGRACGALQESKNGSWWSV